VAWQQNLTSQSSIRSLLSSLSTRSRRSAMASRSLALRLNQGLRAQRAIRAVQAKSHKPGLVRSLATPVSHGSTTESTTLSNGFTVCCH
jgi:processing peptidase subunit beta